METRGRRNGAAHRDSIPSPPPPSLLTHLGEGLCRVGLAAVSPWQVAVEAPGLHEGRKGGGTPSGYFRSRGDAAGEEKIVLKLCVAPPLVLTPEPPVTRDGEARRRRRATRRSLSGAGSSIFPLINIYPTNWFHSKAGGMRGRPPRIKIRPMRRWRLSSPQPPASSAAGRPAEESKKCGDR